MRWAYERSCAPRCMIKSITHSREEEIMTKYTTDVHVLHVAVRVERELWQQHVSYLEECEHYRARGLKPHYCEHGTDWWTDYDNICGGCEDGATLADGVQRRRVALDVAKDGCASFTKLLDALMVFTDNGLSDVLTASKGEINKRLRELLHIPCPHDVDRRASFTYGAPGYGGGVSCCDCGAILEDHGGILTEADVR